MTETTLEERMNAVERLTKLYKPERTVHLIVTAASLLILLGAAGMMVYSGDATTTELGLMFGSSGMVTYTAGQLLKMWDKAVSIIVGGVNNE